MQTAPTHCLIKIETEPTTEWWIHVVLPKNSGWLLVTDSNVKQVNREYQLCHFCPPTRGSTVFPVTSPYIVPNPARLPGSVAGRRSLSEWATIRPVGGRTLPTTPCPGSLKGLRLEGQVVYKATHDACRYALRSPAPRLIQELVKALRASRRRTYNSASRVYSLMAYSGGLS